MRTLLFTLILATTLTGCLRTSSTVLVKKDGTATITDTMLLTRQTMQMWKDVAKATKLPLEKVLREQWTDSSFAVRAADLGEGVRLRNVRMITVSGQSGFVAVYDAKDISTVRFNKNSFHERMGNEAGGSDAPPISASYVTFALQGNVLTISNPPLVPSPTRDDDSTGQMTESELPQQMELVKKLMKDLELTFRIRIASGIASTDASYASADAVTITHLPFNAVMKRMERDPEVFRMMSGIKDPGPYDMERAFNGLSPAVMMETKPVVTVHMK